MIVRKSIGDILGLFGTFRKAGEQAYMDKVLGIGSSYLVAYWSLIETAGATADNYEGTAARDGTYTNVTFGGVTGIGDGNTAPTFVFGDDSRIDIYSASILAALDLDELVISLWFKNSDWVTAGNRWAVSFDNGAAHTRGMYKNAGNFGFYYNGGATKNLLIPRSSVEWTHAFMTVSADADEMKVYLDGVQVDSTQTGLGAWTGNLHVDQTNVGSFSPTGTSWEGELAHVALWTGVDAIDIVTASLAELSTV